ncbi:hypothetical protein [Variovorax boronicumulans]|uniref:hypothetical protein n=1 Tax=Variovorax boronicumulans TaxID=436515 RepID=UPI0012E69EA1|nr:hypothetical protein [Variovorax boronicumulans]GER21306.1 hypothetical protein VCH24_63530 [Variovorax boronicumulans]
MTHPTEPKLPESLEAIRAALDAGPTSGPWETVGSIVRTARRPEDMSGLLIADCGIHDPHRIETAAFIAACNPEAITALLDALKARDAEIERLRGDAERLDYLQRRGATVEILPSGLSWKFQVGGFHGAVNHDIRAAIDQARAEGGEKTK